MAVSNTIGSNVFDILVGLGVPWAIQTMCVSYGSEVSLLYKSSDLTVSVSSLSACKRPMFSHASS